MAGDPTISVLMGVYNEETYLQEAIESIQNQTFEDYEFLIVDDNSDDQSPEIVASYDDDRIRFIQNETNQGLTVSLNRGLERARGKYIARQDADDISEPDRFTRQVEFLEQNTDVALVGSGTYLIDECGDIFDHRIGYCNPTFDDILEKNQFVHGSIMARRSVFERLGGYDEFFRYGQDIDMWLRLAQSHDVANIPEPLYRHRLHDNGVYFSRKNKSAMYSILARDLSTEAVDTGIKTRLEKDITQYYDQLSPARRADFHLDLAIRYLRYGHQKQALKECYIATEYGSISIRPRIVAMLARLGKKPTKAIQWCLRRYLNKKIQIINYFRCPYTHS